MAAAASESFGLSVVKDERADLGIPSHRSDLNFLCPIIIFSRQNQTKFSGVDIIQLQFRLILQGYEEFCAGSVSGHRNITEASSLSASLRRTDLL